MDSSLGKRCFDKAKIQRFLSFKTQAFHWMPPDAMNLVPGAYRNQMQYSAGGSDLKPLEYLVMAVGGERGESTVLPYAR